MVALAQRVWPDSQVTEVVDVKVSPQVDAALPRHCIYRMEETRICIG